MIKIVYFTGYITLFQLSLLVETVELAGISSIKWLTEVVIAVLLLMIILLFSKASNRVKKSELKGLHEKIEVLKKEIEKKVSIEKPVPNYKTENNSAIKNNNAYETPRERKVEKRTELQEPIEIKETPDNLSTSIKQSPITEEDQPAPVFDLKVKTENHNESHVFLGAPDNEKAFYAPEATQTPNANTFYVIDNTKLSLYNSINSQTMKAAMNSVEIHIKRVCDIVNTKEPQHSKIVMIEPGEVSKENEDFLVLNKMKVKFE